MIQYPLFIYIFFVEKCYTSCFLHKLPETVASAQNVNSETLSKFRSIIREVESNAQSLIYDTNVLYIQVSQK